MAEVGASPSLKPFASDSPSCRHGMADPDKGLRAPITLAGLLRLLDVEEVRPALKERHQSVQQVLKCDCSLIQLKDPSPTWLGA